MAVTRYGGCVDYDDEPAEDDAFIQDCSRGYSVSYAGRFIGEYVSRRRAEAVVWCAMERERFWPNVWVISDHGNAVLMAFDSHVLREVR